jgi:hypothetical protein
MAGEKEALVIDLSVVRGAAALDLRSQLFQDEMVRALAMVKEFVDAVDRRTKAEADRLSRAPWEDPELMHEAILISGPRGSGKTTFALSLNQEVAQRHSDDVIVLPPMDPTLIDGDQIFISAVIAAVLRRVGSGARCGDRNLAKSLEQCLHSLSEGLLAADHGAWQKQLGASPSAAAYSERLIAYAQGGLSLRRRVGEFLDAAAKILNKKCFLLPIDDIDVAGKDAWPVLETVRRYLTGPRILPVVTGHLPQFQAMVMETKLCEVERRMKLDAGHGSDSGDAVREVRQLVEQYLLKVIRPERRIQLRSTRDTLRARGEVSVEWELPRGMRVALPIEDLLGPVADWSSPSGVQGEPWDLVPDNARLMRAVLAWAVEVNGGGRNEGVPRVTNPMTWVRLLELDLECQREGRWTSQQAAALAAGDLRPLVARCLTDRADGIDGGIARGALWGVGFAGDSERRIPQLVVRSIVGVLRARWWRDPREWLHYGLRFALPGNIVGGRLRDSVDAPSLRAGVVLPPSKEVPEGGAGRRRPAGLAGRLSSADANRLLRALWIFGPLAFRRFGPGVLGIDGLLRSSLGDSLQGQSPEAVSAAAGAIGRRILTLPELDEALGGPVMGEGLPARDGSDSGTLNLVLSCFFVTTPTAVYPSALAALALLVDLVGQWSEGPEGTQAIGRRRAMMRSMGEAPTARMYGMVTGLLDATTAQGQFPVVSGDQAADRSQGVSPGVDRLMTELVAWVRSSQELFVHGTRGLDDRAPWSSSRAPARSKAARTDGVVAIPYPRDVWEAMRLVSESVGTAGRSGSSSWPASLGSELQEGVLSVLFAVALVEAPAEARRGRDSRSVPPLVVRASERGDGVEAVGLCLSPEALGVFSLLKSARAPWFRTLAGCPLFRGVLLPEIWRELWEAAGMGEPPVWQRGDDVFEVLVFGAGVSSGPQAESAPPPLGRLPLSVLLHAVPWFAPRSTLRGEVPAEPPQKDLGWWSALVAGGVLEKDEGESANRDGDSAVVSTAEIEALERVAMNRASRNRFERIFLEDGEPPEILDFVRRVMHLAAAMPTSDFGDWLRAVASEEQFALLRDAIKRLRGVV